MVRNLEPLTFTLTGLISVSRRECGRRRGQTQARFNTIFYITESKFIFLQALATQSLFANTWNGLFKTCRVSAAICALKSLPLKHWHPAPTCRGSPRRLCRLAAGDADLAREGGTANNGGGGGMLTLAPTRWGGFRPSRTMGEISMPRVAGVRALRCLSHRSPSTKVLIFAQLALRISGAGNNPC